MPERTPWANEELYRELVENANDLIYCIDLQGNLTSFNRAAQRISGYPREEALRMNIAHLVSPEYVDTARQIIQQTMRGEAAHADLEIVRKDGLRVMLEVNHRLLLDRGLPIGAHAIARDITNRRRMETLERDRLEVLEMIATRQPLERILEHVVGMVERQDREAMGMVMLLRDSRLYSVASPSLPEAFVKSLDGMWIGPTSASCGTAAYWRRSIITGDVRKDPLWEEHREAAAAYGLRACWSVPISAATGQVLGTLAAYRKNAGRPKQVHMALLKNAARTASIAIEQRQLTDQLAHQAHHDALTGLPNRVLFQDRLNQAIGNAKRMDTSAALFYIDIDRFKLINDTLGHPAGDRLLIEVAERLSGCIRETDTLARISGDEFTLIAAGLKDHHGVRRLAEAILDSLSEPFALDGHELYVTASIGISFYPKDAEDAGTLLQNADNAMYRAKNAGRNRYEYFAPEMTAAVAQRLAVENYIRRALDREEFFLHYQPQYELENGRQVGQEALLRWRHPKLGMVSPDKFIPVAEESGLIVPIGKWVLEESCRQARAWQREDHSLRTVSVNVSAVQLARADFEKTVEVALAASGLDPRFLELEMTESLVMSDMVEFAKKMARLRELGVRISVDDFGTGYSSLSYLQRLPIDILKLDRSFVEEFKHTSSGSSLVRAVVTLAHGLGIRVTAEGVETEQQLEAVQISGCDQAQGYLLGRPVPAESITQMIRSSLRETKPRSSVQFELAR